jgi:hypothetical protein
VIPTRHIFWQGLNATGAPKLASKGPSGLPGFALNLNSTIIYRSRISPSELAPSDGIGRGLVVLKPTANVAAKDEASRKKKPARAYGQVARAGSDVWIGDSGNQVAVPDDSPIQNG